MADNEEFGKCEEKLQRTDVILEANRRKAKVAGTTRTAASKLKSPVSTYIVWAASKYETQRSQAKVLLQDLGSKTMPHMCDSTARLKSWGLQAPQHDTGSNHMRPSFIFSSLSGVGQTGDLSAPQWLKANSKRQFGWPNLAGQHVRWEGGAAAMKFQRHSEQHQCATKPSITRNMFL